MEELCRSESSKTRNQASTWKPPDEQVSNAVYATERTNRTQSWRLANRWPGQGPIGDRQR